MSVTGMATICKPAGHERSLGAAATVTIYGPRGGYVGATYITESNAREVIARLQAFVGDER